MAGSHGAEAEKYLSPEVTQSGQGSNSSSLCRTGEELGQEDAGFPGGKELSPAAAGDVREAGLTPGSGRSPGTRATHSSLETPMDGGARRAAAQSIAMSQT